MDEREDRRYVPGGVNKLQISRDENQVTIDVTMIPWPGRYSLMRTWFGFLSAGNMPTSETLSTCRRSHCRQKLSPMLDYIAQTVFQYEPTSGSGSAIMPLGCGSPPQFCSRLLDSCVHFGFGAFCTWLIKYCSSVSLMNSGM